MKYVVCQLASGKFYGEKLGRREVVLGGNVAILNKMCGSYHNSKDLKETGQRNMHVK